MKEVTNEMNLFSTVLAQGMNIVPDNIGTGPLVGGADTGATIPGLISYAISILFVVAAVIFFFMLLIGGIKWIISGGDKGQTEAARNQITAALIGLIIVFGAYAITRLINFVFGIDIFDITNTGFTEIPNS